jgi:hypothetical protein
VEGRARRSRARTQRHSGPVPAIRTGKSNPKCQETTALLPMHPLRLSILRLAGHELLCRP